MFCLFVWFFSFTAVSHSLGTQFALHTYIQTHCFAYTYILTHFHFQQAQRSRDRNNAANKLSQRRPRRRRQQNTKVKQKHTREIKFSCNWVCAASDNCDADIDRALRQRSLLLERVWVYMCMCMHVCVPVSIVVSARVCRGSKK